MLSHEQHKAAIKYVLGTLLESDNDCQLARAIEHEGIIEVRFLQVLTDADISSLTYKGQGDTITGLNSQSQSLCKIFREYVAHCNVTGHPVDENWESIDRDDFNHFHIFDYQVSTSTQAPNSLTYMTPLTPILKGPLSELD
jgi:hypothetical protein